MKFLILAVLVCFSALAEGQHHGSSHHGGGQHHGSSRHGQPRVHCTHRTFSSFLRGYTRTTMDGSQKVISMKVLHKYSLAPCALHQSFGFIGGDVWIHRGCRANFEICYQPGHSCTVLCSSNQDRYTECPAPVGRVLEVFPITHHSKAPCILNFSYGRNGDRIWVDMGCRATFRVTG